MIRLWILKILDGFFTLIGEIILFFGIYTFQYYGLKFIVFGFFAIMLGQLAGVYALKYEDKKKLKFFAVEMFENIGRQFSYPVLVFLLYFLTKGALFLSLGIALFLVAIIKSLVILYKTEIIKHNIKGNRKLKIPGNRKT